VLQLIGALAAGAFGFFLAGIVTGKAPRLALPARSRPSTGRRQAWLTQAGLELSPTQYALGLGGVGLLAFAVVSAMTATPVVALAPAALAVVLPHAYFSRKRTRQLDRTQQAWPDAIREVIADIESGSSLQSAMVSLARRGPGPLREAFSPFPVLASTIGVVPALETVRERLADPTSDRVIEVLILAHERGGAIVPEILQDLAKTTGDDLQLQDEIESSNLEQTINARAVFAIPWALLILLVAFNAGFRDFYQSGRGAAVVGIGGGVSAVGMVLVSRLARQSPEPRVFGGSALSTAVAPDEEPA